MIKSQSVYVDLSMPEDKKRAQQKYKTMEGNYLTAGDLALIENRRGYGYGDGYGHYGCYGHGKGMAATGIGLAAGLGGGALIGLFALAYGLNNASKARQKAAENACAGNSKAIDLLANMAICERNSRESWQNQNMPSIVQYTNATSQSGAGAGASASALATAEALALLNNQSNGINSAIGGCNFLRVARYSAPAPCPCDTCQG